MNNYRTASRGRGTVRNSSRSKRIASNAKKFNPFEYWKIFLGILAVGIGYKLFTGVGGFFSGIKDIGNSQYSDQPEASPWSGNGTTPGTTGNVIAGDDITSPATEKNLRELIDLIHVKLVGVNVILYPEIVNRIANLKKEPLKYAMGYWNRKYKGAEGVKLYDYINNEWDGGYYEPALAKIRSYGLQNY